MISTTSINSRSVRSVTAAALLLTATSAALLPAVPAHAATMRSAAVVRESGDSALLQAVKEGSAEKLTAAIAAGDDVSQAGKDGKTALMLAASLGRTDLVQTLLDNGAQVNQLDADGRSALHYVLAGSNPETPKKKRGFGGFIKGALSVAASFSPLASFLPGGPLLQNLAQGMMGKGLPGLMLPGASFGLSNGGAWSGVLGSALMNGAGRGGASPVLGAVDGLLQNNANPATVASSWGTLLSSASSRQPELLTAMNSLGEEATPAERAAWGAFLETAKTGNAEEMQAMVADPAMAPLLEKATSGIRAAAMQIPGRDGGEGIVKALIAKGANTTLADKNGVTPLQRAQNAKLEVVARLLTQPTETLKASL